MAHARIAGNDVWLGVSNRGDADGCGVSKPGTGTLQLAVGFDPRGAWISAQYGWLAVQKLTSIRRRETAILLQCEADLISVTTSSGSLIVTCGARSIQVDGQKAAAALSRFLSGSAALRCARIVRRELRASPDLQDPESSLISALTFVGRLNSPGASWRALRRACSRFLRSESAWIDRLGGVRPLVDRKMWRGPHGLLNRLPAVCNPDRYPIG